MPSTGTHDYQAAREITITTTGNIDNLDIDGCSLLRMNNASSATIRGIKAGYAGQVIAVVSVGAGSVSLEHQNVNSQEANRLINLITASVTFLVAGKGAALYQYDNNTLRWRLIFHNVGTVFTAGSVIFHDGLAPAQDNAKLFWNDALNLLGIGAGAINPLGKVDIGQNNGSWAAIIGADVTSDTRTNAAQKIFRIGGPHYLNAEEPMLFFVGTMLVDQNAIQIGYGSGVGNAATIVAFGTAVNNTTLSGTERARFDNVGNLLFGTTVAPSSGTVVFVIADGTAPSGMPINTAGYYADDVGGTTQLFGINEANEITQLTGFHSSLEVNLGAAAFRGSFTITHPAISSTKKINVWQAPGPYTGKGTRADEAEMQPVSIIAANPGAGSATVYWQTPPIVSYNNGISQRIGKVKGNVKFNYAIY